MLGGLEASLELLLFSPHAAPLQLLSRSPLFLISFRVPPAFLLLLPCLALPVPRRLRVVSFRRRGIADLSDQIRIASRRPPPLSQLLFLAPLATTTNFCSVFLNRSSDEHTHIHMCVGDRHDTIRYDTIRYDGDVLYIKLLYFVPCA